MITACYVLANICQSSIGYAEQLFKLDLLSVMLELLEHMTGGKLELERQSMRCVCAMCQIIATSGQVSSGSFEKVALYPYAINAARK